ncbi:DUF624 domain-containing protein [Bifidobacterium porcinum]|uniref:DUF624 domain-containing protein n=1 Tax=Bifidobacterium porcinum TaxID=212365 RepID=UPI0009DE94A6
MKSPRPHRPRTIRAPHSAPRTSLTCPVRSSASTQALFEIARAIDEGQDGHVLKRFWSAFIRRFGTNLATGAIFLAFYGLIGFDMW